ncbi:hypothetical protein LR48_Vigan02g257100 [Vigna angularis]|uniref:Uncharacterized protein n=1 Tax=Phaseolus angularis TaxID=3914 RepID=A0A0L9U0X3_PHAAN|nr:hypothetical protein LR48_Vigan02g257100 [Vigna angularis]
MRERERERPKERFGKERENPREDGGNGGGLAVVEDSGEVSGGVRDKLHHSNHFSLVVCIGNESKIRKTNITFIVKTKKIMRMKKKKKIEIIGTGGGGRRKNADVEKIGKNGTEPDLQSVVV